MLLPGFDYSRPYYYMVTVKRLPGLENFVELVAPGKVRMNLTTKAFVHIIRTFHERWPGLRPITCFQVMPDHLHLLIGLKGQILGGAAEGWPFASIAKDNGQTLSDYLAALCAALTRAYWETAGESVNRQVTSSLASRPVFEPDFHDWIVKTAGQLPVFTRYIRENPSRAYLRRQNAQYFNRVTTVNWLGRRWYAYGNTAILDLPILEPFQCSRQIAEGSAPWSAAVAAAGRIGPGGAGVSTFMSACEKACGHAIACSGGKFVVLAPENFPPAEGEVVSPAGWRTRWHPPRSQERACAKGDLLYLSLYDPMSREATKAELYQRCHEMGNFVTAALGGKKWE